MERRCTGATDIEPFSSAVVSVSNNCTSNQFVAIFMARKMEMVVKRLYRACRKHGFYIGKKPSNRMHSSRMIIQKRPSSTRQENWFVYVDAGEKHSSKYSNLPWSMSIEYYVCVDESGQMYLIRPEMLRQGPLSILNPCIYVYDKVLLHVHIFTGPNVYLNVYGLNRNIQITLEFLTDFLFCLCERICPSKLLISWK